MKAVGAIPSFLSFGLYGQGDEIEIIWGTKRASNGMAAQSMLKAGVPFTLSHDAPITPPMIMPLISAAVNRVTSSGKVLGADQRISPYQALQAVTSAAAYQIKEEKSKGTIQAGKLADFVILDNNPLKVTPAKITEINVVQTIKEGKSIFKLSSPRAYTPVSMSDHHHETGQQKPLSKSQQKIVARLVQSAQ
jgi:predicted amidohydrolase YtcJ